MPRTKSAPGGGTSSYVYAHSASCSVGYHQYAESHPAASSRASESGKGSTLSSTSALWKALDEHTSSSGVSKPKGKKRKIEAIVSGGDMNGEPSTPKPKRTRKKKDPDAPVPEKRGAIFKKKCPQSIIERVERVISQRFFLINRQRNGEELREEFSVLGSTGNVYIVTIDKRPSCTCPDAMKGNHCKHILFVYTKVLQVPQSSHVWYQKALLTSELEEIFRNAPPAPNYMANAQLREAYNKATGKASSSTQTEQARRALSEEDSCAICYESMHDAQESLLTWCQTCGNALHKECFQQWAKRKSTNLDCVYCRSPWALSGTKAKGGKTSEGYLNLADVAGVSPVRDTSTYYHGPRRGQRYYGYQDYDEDLIVCVLVRQENVQNTIGSGYFTDNDRRLNRLHYSRDHSQTACQHDVDCALGKQIRYTAMSASRKSLNDMPTTLLLPILHFNDVYRVNPQKIAGGAKIDVTQFAYMLDSLRERWPVSRLGVENGNGRQEGLVLFSGDLFAPSVESSVTRGSHMVPVINELAPDIAVTGNHDFDFGYPHLTKLINDTKFPWLLSNIIDETTGKIPEHLHEVYVLERRGVRIGFIGLVESEWITTVPTWPTNFKYRDMTKVALELSMRLRDPQGEYRCDIIIALTHSRIPNDIRLAKSIKALSPKHQPADFASTHGADLIFGGHDHLYYASRGVNSWEGYDLNQEVLGAEEDEDVLVIKSGTDFRDLSEVIVELEDAPEGSIRQKIIKSVKGKRHETRPESPSSQSLKEILSKVLDSVSDTMKKPVCNAAEPLDLRSEIIRTQESSSGDWFADVIYHAYDDALCNMGIESADGVFLCAGALRGDTVYGPGNITLGDIMEILPFEDSILVLELDGETIWEAFEAGLATWPAQEGRFPVIAGFRVTWDSRRPPGQRVLNIAVQTHKRADPHRAGDSTPNLLIEYGEVQRERGGRKFVVVTREYMAQGHGGFECLKDQKMLINDEEGQMMSTIVRKYLLGSKYINKMHRLLEQSEKAGKPKLALLHHDTERILRHTREAKQRAKERWEKALNHVRDVLHSPAHYRAPLSICRQEHMGSADCFDGERVRAGQRQQRIEEEDEDLPVITPLADGRLRDVTRARD